MQPSGSNDGSLPIACTLSGKEIRARKASLLPGLVARATLITATADGYKFHFESSGDVLRVITETLEAERQCCRFLRFDLSLDPDCGPILLTVSGPPGTREFLVGLLDPE